MEHQPGKLKAHAAEDCGNDLFNVDEGSWNKKGICRTDY